MRQNSVQVKAVQEERIRRKKKATQKGGTMKSSIIIGGASNEYRRKEADFYPTPAEVTQALINTGVIPTGGCIWEPACGDGHMAQVFEENGYSVTATDIRETNYCHNQSDFLTAAVQIPVTAIVTNPPFNQSSEFIQRCIDLEVPVFAMLLKSQYWHSVRRAALFEKYPPAYVMPLTWRPAFCREERGSSPTMDMLWTVWIAGETDTKYRLLRKPA